MSDSTCLRLSRDRDRYVAMIIVTMHDHDAILCAGHDRSSVEVRKKELGTAFKKWFLSNSMREAVPPKDYYIAEFEAS